MKKNLFTLGSLVSLAMFSPAVASAAVGCTFTTTSKVGDLFDYITCLINNSVIPAIFAIAVVMFLWGVVKYFLNSDEEAKKSEGKQYILWGLIAMTVMIGIWGLVNILGATFSIKTNALPQVRPISN